MTEEEAAMKQCCGPEGCGRFNDEPYPARWCVGSVCMGFRWDPTFVHNSAVQMGPNYDARARAARPGFCGLAGAPR